MKTPPRHSERYLEILGTGDAVGVVESGPAYCWSDEPLSRESTGQGTKVIKLTSADAEMLHGGFDDFVSELPLWQPFVALSTSRNAISICRSARITSEAHEAGVETLPPHRGHGYAAQVTAAWAGEVRSLGAVPLYSTSWTNHASQAVARKMGLSFFGSDYHIN